MLNKRRGIPTGHFNRGRCRRGSVSENLSPPLIRKRVDSLPGHSGADTRVSEDPRGTGYAERPEFPPRPDRIPDLAL
ncbi:hypothetical protein AAFF_G00049300 [Aldrovandia affinis]|uniref:Uncharacterized protein n=1 Tax=Aldrovandia affinis TaxID=143900 RepID=A0AAD7WEY9_9TELE|nr:hypothetical protein AAFF_G00049300 [Aldrovandia affinis]